MESAPQMILQLYIALTRGYTDALVVSLFFSLASLGLSLASSDKASVESHAARTLGKRVTFPLTVARIKHKEVARTPCSATCAGRRVMLSTSYAIVCLYRIVEVIARLSVTALLCAVVRGWVLVALVFATFTAGVWWLGGLPIAWALFARRPDVWKQITSLMPLPAVSVGQMAPVIMYTTVAFPGVVVRYMGGTAGDADGMAGGPRLADVTAQPNTRAVPSERARPTGTAIAGGSGTPAGGIRASMLPSLTGLLPNRSDRSAVPTSAARRRALMISIEPWMQSVWSFDWTLSSGAFCFVRSLEQLGSCALVYVELRGARWP